MISDRVRNILNKACETAQELMDFDRFYIVFYDPLKSILEFPIVKNKKNRIEWQERPFQKNSVLPDLLIRDRKTVLFDGNVKASLEKYNIKLWPDSDIPQSWLGVPMILEDKAVGALVAEHYENPGSFGEREKDLLSTIARQTSIAVENARQKERMEKQNERFRVLNELGVQLNSDVRRDEQAIFELIYQSVSQLMNTDNMYIALYERDKNIPDQYNSKNPKKSLLNGTIHFKLMFQDGQAKAPWSRRPKLGEYGRTEVIISTKKEIFNKTEAESKAWYKEFGHKEFIGTTFASWLGVPILIGGEVLGVIATYHSTDDFVYDEDDLQVLSMMADQAASALKNSGFYRQLEDANRQLEDKVEELELMAAVGEITAGLIHKISNSLGLIPTWINRIFKNKKNFGEKEIKKLEHIKSCTSDALKYTSNIAGNISLMKMIKEPVHIGLILDDALSAVSSALERQGVKKVINSKDFKKIPEIMANPSTIREMLLNLFRNALDAMNFSPGTLTIAIDIPKDREGVEVQISDTGCGIPQDKQENVFKYGFTTKEKGTGIGLWFCQKVVAQHKGEIDFQSNEERGTTFKIFLPKGLNKSEVSDA